MSFFKNKIPVLLILSVFLSLEVEYLSSESGNPASICQGKNPNFFLSLALRSQAKAKQMVFSRNQKEALSLYQDSVKDFENYFLCMKGGKVPSEVHLNAAISYLELGEYKKAEDEVSLSLSKDGKNREAIIIHTKLLIRQGRLEEAEKFLDAKISNSPEDSDFLFLLGSLNKETGRLNKAILYFTSLYDSIMKRNGNPRYKIHALKNLADIYYQKGDAKKSLYYYQGYLVMNPRDTNAKFQVAQIFNVMGDFGASRRILQSIQKENPQDRNVELLLAEMHFVESRKTSYPYFKSIVDGGKVAKTHLVYALYSILTGDWLYADGFLRAFIPKHENRIAARLAWIEVLRERYSEADLIAELKSVSELAYSIRQYQLAYNLSKELLNLQVKNNEDADKIAYTNWFLSNCMEQRESPNRAILYGKEAIRLAVNPKDKERYKLHLGHILLGEKIKRYQEGLRIADSILSDNPNSSAAFYLQAYAYFLLKKNDSGLQSIDKALEIEPSNSGYYFFRGMVYERLNKPSEVELNMRKSIELLPDSPAAYNYLGYYFADRKENLPEALSLIQKAVELEPDNGAYQDSLGWVFFRMNDLENALFHLYLAKQMLEDRGIKDFTVYDHLGDVYFAKEEGAIARDYWKKALGLVESKEDQSRIQKKINTR